MRVCCLYTTDASKFVAFCGFRGGEAATSMNYWQLLEDSQKHKHTHLHNICHSLTMCLSFSASVIEDSKKFKVRQNYSNQINHSLAFTSIGFTSRTRTSVMHSPDARLAAPCISQRGSGCQEHYDISYRMTSRHYSVTSTSLTLQLPQSKIS